MNLNLSDPSFVAQLKPGLDGLVLTYTIGLQGSPNLGSDGSAGGDTTVTFKGTTITAYGGQGGNGASEIAYGGSYSGGDGGQQGGGANGGDSTWSKGGPGGGAIGRRGGNDGGYYYGGHGAATSDSGGTNIIAQFLAPAGIDYSSFGVGNTDAGYSAEGFGCGGGGGGGPGASGGYGGNGKFGGGGGGATSGQGSASGGYGGTGCVLIRRTLGDGSFAYVTLTGGNTWTVPANTKEIKVWAIGGGGAGASVYGSPQTVGGGGAAGGICYKTWSV